MISVMSPNKNRIRNANPPNTMGIGKPDDMPAAGDGRITNGLAATFPTGKGVGVCMLMGVIPSSAAKTAARAI